MDWKFKLGDMVVPVMQHGYEHASKMLIVGLVTEEFIDHSEHSYLCSHFKLGDVVRQRFMPAELVEWKAKS